MQIKKLTLTNYRRFRNLTLDLSDGLNVLVGKNDAGKSTILEAVHLAFTGLIGGRYLRNELSQHLFNNQTVAEYIDSLRTETQKQPPPFIRIEIFLADKSPPELWGNANSTKLDATGFSLNVCFDEKYQKEYQELVLNNQILTVPIEYYEVYWRSFARFPITPRTLPLRSAMIDSSAHRYQNGSDVYMSQIVRDFLDTDDVVGITQAYRRMKETFGADDAITRVNSKLKAAAPPSTKRITLAPELPGKTDWQDSVVTCVEDIPFHYIGKGEQCLLKTKLALRRQEVQKANVILLEEPENHLTHANLNNLLRHVKTASPGRQVILSTHSSFVANKLGLDSLALLNDGNPLLFTSLQPDTKRFFEKISGYDTLRLVLAKKTILVEGDSDELVVQKAYLAKYGRLPIEDGVDVISVGTAFLRFLEIADHIGQEVAVVTDTDGNPASLEKKYAVYLGPALKPHIRICFDPQVDSGFLTVSGKPFNYNTLEPKLLKENSLELMNQIFGTTHADIDEMHKYMLSNKTECALQVFETNEDLKFPDYIVQAIS